MITNPLHIIRTVFSRRAVVLLYHRVARAAHDHWKLSVSPQHFEEQLQVLQHYNVMPLPELAQHWGNNKLPRKSVAISFDDGYIDNYTTARPLLEKYNLPATFFITNGSIGTGNEFWWDELEQMFVTDPDKHLQAWEQLLPMRHQQQQAFLAELRTAHGIEKKPRPDYTCMSRDQLKEMAATPLFTLGAHTVTHVALAHQPAAVQEQEMVNNSMWLQELTGKAPALLAYPYGNYNEATVNIASQLGFYAAFTTDPQPISKHSARYRLGRFQVHDWSGAEFERQLNKWLLVNSQ